jgi:very-short-patch-repair endonuclease
VLREFTVTLGASGRFRLDGAVFCTRGAVAIECDADAWHSRPAQRRRDAAKDAALRRFGWTVVRLRENAIVRDAAGCIRRVRAAIRRHGGPAAAP